MNYHSSCDLRNKNNVAVWEHIQTGRPIVRMTASIRMFYLGSGRIRSLCKEMGREKNMCPNLTAQSVFYLRCQWLCCWLE